MPEKFSENLWPAPSRNGALTWGGASVSPSFLASTPEREAVVQAFFHRFSMTLFLLTATAGVLFAQDAKPKEAYQTAWQDVSELLRRREYGSALAKLDSLVEERDLRDSGKQIAEDRKAIAGLQTLERLVREQAAKLSGGEPLEVSGISYVVVRYDSAAKGESLILKSRSTGKETTLLVADLPAVTWMYLVESQREALRARSFTLGVFLGFDRTADRKAARKFLNEAAQEGEDVMVWLARLDEQEARQKEALADRKAAKDDPVVGRWLVQMSTKDGAGNFSVDFRKMGGATSTLTPKSRDDVRRHRPRSSVPISTSGKWTREEDGSYRVSFSSGMTWEFTITDEDHFDGKMPGGRSLKGVRQVK